MLVYLDNFLGVKLLENMGFFFFFKRVGGRGRGRGGRENLKQAPCSVGAQSMTLSHGPEIMT